MSFLLFHAGDFYRAYAGYFTPSLEGIKDVRYLFTFWLLETLPMVFMSEYIVIWCAVVAVLSQVGAFVKVCLNDHLIVLETQAQAALEAAHVLILVSQHDEVFHSYIECVCNINSTPQDEVFSSNINSSPSNVRVLRLGRSGWFVDDVVQDPQQIHTQAQLILAQRQAPIKVEPVEEPIPALLPLPLPLPEPTPVLVPVPVPQKQETKYPYLSLWRSVRLIAAICVGYYAIVAVV